MRVSTRAMRLDLFAVLIAPVVFLSRWLVRSRPYFGDSARLVAAAQNHTYVIQPPGYWLYVRLASLFSDPAFALTLANAIASALGTVIFYLLALKLATPTIARLATIAYGCVYFAWFAGAIQATYAGELLCVPLLLLLMLRYCDDPKPPLLIGVAASYSLAAGVRPPDGAFLLPAFLYFLWRHVPDTLHRVVAVAVVVECSALWFLPQHAALARLGASVGGQLWAVAAGEAPLLHPFSKLALSNIVRTVFPLLLAFWSLLPAVFARAEHHARTLLWIALLPGLAFFALVYISDATYLCYLVPVILSLAIASPPRKLASAGLCVCFASNLLFFCLAKPLDRTGNLAAAVYSVSGARYCAWALKHQWYRTLRTYDEVPAIRAEQR